MEEVWLTERPPSDLLEVAGADRLRFSNGYLTCDVKSLVPGRSGFGFFTAREGRVLASADLVSLADRLLLAVPAGRGEAMRDHLRRYVISERVSIDEASAESRWTLGGEGARGALESRGFPVPAPGEVLGATLDGAPLAIAWRPLGRHAACDLWLRRADEATLLSTFAGAARDEADWERRRIEEGVGLWGVDYGADHFPQESGREAEAVSYSKGCYLGQEVVARIHYRGGVQRALVGLRFDGALPVPGTALWHDGREAGRLGSVADSPRCGPIGLAVLHRRAAEPGTALALEGGGAARVAALPFAPLA